MNYALLCVATDGYGSLWDFCLDSHKNYCDRHGIERRVIVENMGGLNSKWTKLLAARELLRAGYAVLVVDADTEISSSAPHFSLAMTDDSKGIFVAIGASGRPNSGVMMFRGTPLGQALEFLDECLRQRDRPVDPDCFVTQQGENGHIIHFLKREPFARYFGILARNWNCSIPDEAASAHIRHFTNYLRESLEDGSWQCSDTLQIYPTDAAESRLFDRWRLHHLARRETVLKLDSDPMLLEMFRQSIRPPSDQIEFPRLVYDDANGWIWRYEFAMGLLETPTWVLLRRLSRSDGVFLDAGAHVGYFSLMLATAGNAPRRILAVEAHPENFQGLVRNLLGTRSACVHAALAESCGTIEFFDGQGHSNSTIYQGNPTTGIRYAVEKITIDEIMYRSGVQILDLAKIDIEGAEPLALEGAAATFARSPNVVVVVESNPALLRLGGFSPFDIVLVMERHGLLGREIRDDFTLGPSGYIRARGTLNIVFARKERWREIEGVLKGT